MPPLNFHNERDIAEATAIKNRGFDEGYDFLLMVPLDGPACVPDWVPAVQIWADLERLGVGGAAAVIERMISERGKAVRPETAEDVAARLDRQREEELDRESFLRSTEGVHAADAEFARLKDLIVQRRDALELRLDLSDSRGATVTRDDRSMTLNWFRSYCNTLDESGLRIQLWDGIVSHSIDPNFHAKRVTSELRLRFDRYSGEIGWRETGRQRRFFTTEELAERALKVLVKAAYEQDEPL